MWGAEGAWSMRRAVTLVCLLSLVVAATAGTVGADPESELDELRRELEGARGGLDQLDGRRSATMVDLEASQARQAALDARLQTLNAELGAAQAALAEADATLGRTTTELEGTEQRLEGTRQDLEGALDTFADRARASYMYGGAGASTSMLLGIRDVTQFNRALAYVERIMASDRQHVTLVGNLEREIEAAVAELALLQQRHRRERQVAHAERDRVGGLVAEQQVLHDAAVAEADRHATILAELDADRASHVALIDSLEAESDKLEEELRRRAEEARRVAAAEAARSSRAARSPAPLISTSGWRRPSDGRLSSGYGTRRHPIYGTSRMHTGVDFGAPRGAPIYAVTDGTVVSAGWRGGYGMAVVVDHGGGLATLYAHASGLDVAPGQRVSRGQAIARTGTTGQSTGPHLHFEVRVNGRHRDPMPYL